MNALYAATLVLLGLIGQEAPEGAAPETPAAPALAPERVRILAIRATSEQRATPHFDPSLEPLENYLSALPWNTFREYRFEEVEAPYGVETTAPVDDRYQVTFTPSGMNDEDEVLFDASVNLTEAGETLEALAVSGRAARGHGIVFRGLGIPDGELIVVVSVAEPPEPTQRGAGRDGEEQPSGDPAPGSASAGSDSGGGSGQGGPGEDADEEPDWTLEAAPPEDEEAAEPNVPEAAEGYADGDAPETPDTAALEAILRSLEEQDMREQKNARNRRYDVVIQGAWW